MVIRNHSQLAFRLPERGLFMDGELVIDSFAGAGGVSLAMENVFGRSPDIAINHNKIALETHAMNHPTSLHIRENIWKVNPKAVVRGRPVGLFWASPDCTHFSKAKGGKPVKQRVRGLANIVVKWARDTRPRVIGMENVEEFQTWGPLILLRNSRGRPKLDKEGKRQYVPDKARKGEYFRGWKAALERLGYQVEHRMICCADFGAPTSRTRFFLFARRDGRAIRWPEVTHGPGLIPYRMAADCIDFDDPCPSIFTRKRPLRPATLRRIALGVIRYVLNDPFPFLLNLTHGGRLERLDLPMRTVTRAHRGEKAMVSPTIMTNYSGHRGRHVREPLPTQTRGPHHALVATFLNKHYTGVIGQSIRRPASTITRSDHHSLGAVHMTKFRKSCKAGKSIRDPFDTITTAKGGAGGHFGMVSAFLNKYNGTAIGQRAGEPVHTVTAKARFGVIFVTIDGSDYVIEDIGMRMLQPRELARAHDFPDSYFLIGTKEQQIAMIGNSVPWKPAAAMLRANFQEEEAMMRMEAIA